MGHVNSKKNVYQNKHFNIESYDTIYQITQMYANCDVDWANNIDNHLFTLGYVFLLGNGSISGNNKKQPYIAMSSTKVEYMTNTQATKQ